MLAAAGIYRTDHGTDCDDGFSLPLGCALNRDHTLQEWRQSWDAPWSVRSG